MRWFPREGDRSGYLDGPTCLQAYKLEMSAKPMVKVKKTIQEDNTMDIME